MLRRSPTPFCPAAALPEVGSYIAREAARHADRRGARQRRQSSVRSRNACRHRGMQVASDPGCARAFVCRYHGWTYNLEGRLRHIPHEEGFPGFDKEAHPLVPMTASGALRSGVRDSRTSRRWATIRCGGLDQADRRPTSACSRRPSASSRSTGRSCSRASSRAITSQSRRIPRASCPYGFDNLNVIDLFGRNSRVTYPFQRIKKLGQGAAAAAPRRRPADLRLSPVPQRAGSHVLSRHTNVVILEPLAVDRTRQITYTLTNGGRRRSAGPGRGQARRRVRRHDRCGGGSRGGQAIQRGLGSGANDAFTFGHFESAIVHFHKTLTAALTLGC